MQDYNTIIGAIQMRRDRFKFCVNVKNRYKICE